jgi:hypothetical protein
MTQRSPLAIRLLGAAAIAALAAPAIGATISATPASATASRPTATLTAVTGLSGQWSGQYSGAYTGTFNLTWRQSGSNLSGTIEISSLGNKPTNINGSLQGHQIKFGTVGGAAVAFTGTASSSSMSGNWHFQAKHSIGGSWSAAKSS